MVRNAIIKLIERLRDERGQALITVLVLLMIGSLTLPPVLSHISTALKTGRIYESRTDELYAADSGIEDAIWQTKYDRLEVLFSDPAYDIYDYSTVWSYSLSEPINGLPVDVSIENIWIPKDVAPPGPAEARNIIESNKLMVAGTVPGESTYQIKISFYPGEGEENDLMIESLGVWLPLGYTYLAGSSNLEDDPFSDYYSVPVVEDHAGGQAVLWSFSSVPFTSFPGVDPMAMPMISDVTFSFNSSQPGVSPVAISWIETSGVSDVPLSWDIDTRIHRITSVSGDTEIEAYFAKCELRKMGAAISGDYHALGNSLMRDTIPDSYDIRDELLAESDAEVVDIPSNADVVAAYLYWSGWFGEGTVTPIFVDDCSNFGEWISGSCWNIDSSHFRSHYSSGAEDTRYLTMKNSLDLSSYGSGTVKVSWDQWEEGWLESSDALKFQFSGDGGNSWSEMVTAFSNDIGSVPQHFSHTVPDEYLTDNFQFRFYLQNFGGSGEYCNIDDFAVAETVFTPDTSVIFKINDNQVYIDEGGDPQIGEQEITASKWSVLENEPGEYSYACYLDVSKLVKEYSDLGDDDNHTGNGKYTVGGVDADTGNQWSYAGWSLIIIYSSPETAGHQLYLYDDFIYSDMDQNVDFDGDGEPGGSITGFVVPEPIEGEEYAATLTCFVGEGDNIWSGDSLAFNGTTLSDGGGSPTNVWDSQSIGMSEDGVDIDTFHVTWASGLLEPGDSMAQLDLITGTDSWNLVYMILSLRSETVTGGTTHYVIHWG